MTGAPTTSPKKAREMVLRYVDEATRNELDGKRLPDDDARKNLESLLGLNMPMHMAFAVFDVGYTRLEELDLPRSFNIEPDEWRLSHV